jgi:ABC-type multidrug transport system fused ATPase/permease subunit
VNPLVRLLPSLRTPEASPVTRLLVAGVCGLLAASAAQIAGPMLVAHAIDVDLAAGDRRGLAIRCALYAGTLVATLGATLGSRVALEIAAQRAMLALKRRLFDHLVGQDMAFHDRMPSGALIGRVQGDVEALRVLLVEVLLAAPADALLMVGMLCVLFAQVPVLAPPIAAVLPVWFALFLVFRWVAPQRFVLERAAAASTTGLLTEVVRSLPALRVLGRHPWAIGLAEERIGAQARAEIASHLQSIWYFNGVQAIRAAATVA